MALSRPVWTAVTPAFVVVVKTKYALHMIDPKFDGAWELPAIGVITAPTAVLIRPDGYVGWVGEKTQAGLVDALTTWFGSAGAA